MITNNKVDRQIYPGTLTGWEKMLFEKFFNNAGTRARAKMPEFKRIKSSVPEQQELSGDLEKDLNLIIQAIGEPADLVVHRMFNLDDNRQPIVIMLYLKSLADGPALGLHVVDPLNRFINETKKAITPIITAQLLAAAEVLEYQDLRSATNSLLAGNALLFFPGFPRRQIEEPKTEQIIRGPREGFTEVLTDNLGMIRRSIKDPNLRVEKLFLGERTKTEINILFLQDVANPDIVIEVRKRLKQINIDSIVDSGTDQTKGFKSIVSAAGLAGFFIFLAVFETIGIYGAKGVLIYSWPFLELGKETNIPYISQTFGLFISSVLLIQTVFGSSALFYAAAQGFSELLGGLKYKYFLLILTPIVFIAAIITPDVVIIRKVFDYLRIIGFVVVLVLPLLIWLLAVLLRKGVKPKSEPIS